ncbi:hypothetical protein A2U01_0113000, partial [Trifolium medium]|nr:hypothetical protein [Trifolium medium]
YGVESTRRCNGVDG